jgi:hypothetical protein
MLKGTERATEGDALMAAALSSDPTANEDYATTLIEVIVSDQAIKRESECGPEISVLSTKIALSGERDTG